MLSRSLENTQPTSTSFPYKLSLGGFIAFFALILLAMVDFRRGFLFTDYVRSPYWAYHPVQALMLTTGILGMVLCYQRLKSHEAHATISSKYGKTLAFAMLGLLLIDLFTYRGVPAVRAIASGKLGTDWLQAFGVTGWFRPVALSVSYLLTVWHATLLGILIAGLALTVLPAYLKPFFSRTGLAGTLFGALYAIPQPFCSCCAATMAPSYTRRGASTDFALSFVVGSPMLNITTIILAFALLPMPFAITRAVAGVILAIAVPYGVARLAERWNKAADTTPAMLGTTRRSVIPHWLSRWMQLYLDTFQLETLVRDRKMDTPTALVSVWLYACMRLALILVPTLLFWSVVASAIVQILPSAFGNNLPGVVLAAFTGTLLMISTWTEIPVALQLIQSGLTGPAATLLVVLPPVSLPCLMLLSGSLGRFRIVVLLGLVVIVIGIITGVLFL